MPPGLPFGNELVHHDGAVVVGHVEGNTAVVVLVTDAPTATVVEMLVAEQAFLVPIPQAFSIHGLAHGAFSLVKRVVVTDIVDLPFVEAGRDGRRASQCGGRRPT